MHGPPRVLQEPSAIEGRTQELLGRYQSHFDRLLLLDQYSRRSPQSWFPVAKINVPSVVRSTIRAVEKTVIAYLTGNEPQWKVSSLAGEAGRAEQDPSTGSRDSKFERLAAAIYHTLDKQSETPLLVAMNTRLVRQGEIIARYRWLSEAERTIEGPRVAQLGGDVPPELPLEAGPLLGADPLAAPLAGPGAEGDLPPGTPAPLLPPPAPRRRFPVQIQVLNRLRVVYTLDPHGEPLEVYHRYTTTGSQAAEEFPNWSGAEYIGANDTVSVIDAYVGAYHAVVVQGELVQEPVLHHYGPRPPFIIEQAMPEDVSDQLGQDLYGGMELLAGIPFCADMMEAFAQACRASSLKLAMIENAAIGAWVLKHTSARRQEKDQEEDDIVMGPGTITELYDDEELVPAPTMQLSPVLATYLEEAERDLAMLSFSPSLLMGDASGEPSGHSIHEVRQAAMARLQPYKQALSRAMSRLFEKIFAMLAESWAPEWGDQLVLAGQHKGSFFQEGIRPDELQPPPGHVEVRIIPAVPQDKIAEEQHLIAQWQAGTKDILSVMEESNVPEPQEEWNNVLLHKTQFEDPAVRNAAIAAILRQRAGIPSAPAGMPAPGGMPVPGGLPGAPMPPGPVPGGMPPGPPSPPMPNAGTGITGPGAPEMTIPGQPGPPARQRDAASPMGVEGAPSPPLRPLPKGRPGRG